MRVWHFEADMTGDGVTTISDFGAWVGWLFYYPGDYILSLIIEDPTLGTFFEVSPTSYGNWFSAILSAVIWIIGGSVWYAIDEWRHSKMNKSDGKRNDTN